MANNFIVGSPLLLLLFLFAEAESSYFQQKSFNSLSNTTLAGKQS